jgi:hypothetical protein
MSQKQPLSVNESTTKIKLQSENFSKMMCSLFCFCRWCHESQCLTLIPSLEMIIVVISEKKEGEAFPVKTDLLV